MAVDISLTASAEDTATLSSYTFADQSIGAAADDRDVVVGVMFQQGNRAETLTSATIAGLAATIDVQQNVGGAISDDVALIRARIPAGTTADIVVNFSGGLTRASIDVYRVTGAQTTLNDTAGISDNTTLAVSLDVPAGGGAIGTAMAADGGGTGTWTWTGLTEDTDRTVKTANVAHSSAHDEFATEQLGLSITAGASGGTEQGSLAAVSFAQASGLSVTGTNLLPVVKAEGMNVGRRKRR